MLLQGLRILAVEQYGAGPFGTQFLSSLGAEVIKIENPNDGGDMSRSVGPYFREELPETARSVFFQGLNIGKKSVTLDITRPEGREIFRRLAAGAHGVASNLRGDVPEKIGITYSHLADVNPRIVCSHLTGYGRGNAREKWPGYDYLMQAETGYFHLTGEPDSPPARFGLSMIDLMTGLAMSFGLLAGIREAERSGRGRDLDVSLFDLSLFNLNYIGNWYLNAGAVTTRTTRSAHPSLTPCQTYRTQDGWIYLMCNKEKFWGILCGKVGRPELAKDARFLTFKERLANRDLITQLLDEALSAKTTAEWLVDFAGSVPASPILDVKQALDNPWANEGDRIQRIPLPGADPLRLLRNPIRTGEPPVASTPAPALGAHTEEILAGIGITGEAFAALRRQGIA
ncbi:MAG: CoA transferase [Betaproteobacteria bacterium]|nr:CoA transferase [Betaproteobacteria bacterium]